MKKGQQNGGILPEKREGYLKAVEFIIHRLMNFPDNQTRKMGGTNGCRNALSAGAAERSAVFRGTRACMPEAAQPQVASPPEKPRGVREVWRSQTCNRSRFSFAFFSLAKQRKESACAGMRRKGEQAGNGKGYLKFGKLPKSNVYLTKFVYSQIAHNKLP